MKKFIIASVASLSMCALAGEVTATEKKPTAKTDQVAVDTTKKEEKKTEGTVKKEVVAAKPAPAPAAAPAPAKTK